VRLIYSLLKYSYDIYFDLHLEINRNVMDAFDVYRAIQYADLFATYFLAPCKRDK